MGTRACASLTSCSVLPSQCLITMELLPHSHCHSFSHHPSVPVAKQQCCISHRVSLVWLWHPGTFCDTPSALSPLPSLVPCLLHTPRGAQGGRMLCGCCEVPAPASPSSYHIPMKLWIFVRSRSQNNHGGSQGSLGSCCCWNLSTEGFPQRPPVSTGMEQELVDGYTNLIINVHNYSLRVVNLLR